MNATLRNRIAPALLLAPLAAAALFAARPAQAQVFVRVPGATVVAVDEHGGDFRRGGFDHRAPRISDMTPANGERVSERGRTEVSARIHDGGTGIDYRSIALRVDGRDVTSRTRVHENEVRFRDDLAPGRHFAELSVRDRAGNVARQAWSFDVAGRHGGGERYGYYNNNFSNNGYYGR